MDWTIVRRRTVTKYTTFPLLATLLTRRLRRHHPFFLALLLLLAKGFRISWRFLTKVITIVVVLVRKAYSTLPLLFYFLSLVPLRRLVSILFHSMWRSAMSTRVSKAFTLHTIIVSCFVLPSAITVFSLILHFCCESLFRSLTTMVRLLVWQPANRSTILKELNLTKHSNSASCLLLNRALNRHKDLLCVSIML